jgi:hypothetical protein
MLSAFAISVAPKSLRLQLPHLGGIYRGRPALVDARDLGLGDTLKLALAAQIGLGLGDRPDSRRQQVTHASAVAAAVVAVVVAVALVVATT